MGVILNDFRKTVEIELPDYPGSKVVLFQGVLVKDVGDLPLIDEKSTVADAIKILPMLIKSWNFTDKDGKDLPVSHTCIGLLSVDAVKLLVDAAVVGKDVKKN